jgi:hypothetical protein
MAQNDTRIDAHGALCGNQARRATAPKIVTITTNVSGSVGLTPAVRIPGMAKV